MTRRRHLVPHGQSRRPTPRRRGHPAAAGRRRDPGRRLPQARRQPAGHLPARVGRAGPQWSRWSFVGVRCAGSADRAGRPGAVARRRARRPSRRPARGGARGCRAACASPRDPEHPPLTGGLVGYLGYDVVRRLERLPSTAPDDLGMPELAMMLATDLAVLDHADGTVLLIANVAARAAPLRRRRRPGSTRWPPTSPTRAAPTRRDPRPRRRCPRCAAAPRRRTTGRRRARARAHPRRRRVPGRALASGSRCDTDVDALDVYRVLRATNPSPYMYLLRFAGDESPYDVVGCSPGGAGDRDRRRGRSCTRRPAPARAAPRPEEDARARRRAARRPQGARPST